MILRIFDLIMLLLDLLLFFIHLCPLPYIDFRESKRKFSRSKNPFLPELVPMITPLLPFLYFQYIIPNTKIYYLYLILLYYICIGTHAVFIDLLLFYNMADGELVPGSQPQCSNGFPF